VLFKRQTAIKPAYLLRWSILNVQEFNSHVASRLSSQHTWFYVSVTEVFEFDWHRQFYKMALSDAYVVIKYLMFIFNFIFWVNIVTLVMLV